MSRYISYTETYDPYTWKASKRVTCVGPCGKKLRRQRTFSETQSPFNKNANGEPKSVQDIYASLQEKAERWERQPEVCDPCLDLHNRQFATVRLKDGEPCDGPDADTVQGSCSCGETYTIPAGDDEEHYRLRQAHLEHIREVVGR